MRTHIHPDYWMYRGFIESIPKGEYVRSEVFCNHRNIVEKVEWGTKTFVVKKYKRPTWVNSIVYTWFRDTKARRAYERAIELQRKGIGTAQPVAYIEVFKYGFFHTGYFISEYLPYPLIRDLKKGKFTQKEKQEVGKALIAFTAHLHAQGIVPKDYNSGNIFFHKKGEEYRFALIDINRIRIGQIPQERDSTQFFDQLGINISKAIHFIDQYATLRGFNTDRCIFYILCHRAKKKIERQIKKYILHPIRTIPKAIS